jgi:hypothetical protein
VILLACQIAASGTDTLAPRSRRSGESEGAVVANGRRESDAGYNAAAWPERERALRYREQAARFDEMAGTESRDTMRDRLVDLARQYRALAESLEAKFHPAEP